MTQPNPQVYPKCSECEAPYVLRMGFDFGAKRPGAATWAWFRDCKHKKAPPVIVDVSKEK